MYILQHTASDGNLEGHVSNAPLKPTSLPSYILYGHSMSHVIVLCGLFGGIFADWLTDSKTVCFDPLYKYMWQSQVEIKYYSVTYFECITKFDAL